MLKRNLLKSLKSITSISFVSIGPDALEPKDPYWSKTKASVLPFWLYLTSFTAQCEQNTIYNLLRDKLYNQDIYDCLENKLWKINYNPLNPDRQNVKMPEESNSCRHNIIVEILYTIAIYNHFQYLLKQLMHHQVISMKSGRYYTTRVVWRRKNLSTIQIMKLFSPVAR